MKHLYSITLSLLLLLICTSLQAQTPTPNYAGAERYSPKKLKKMVFSTSVDPHWLKESNRFWYSYETSNGKQWYIVDPTVPSKKELFNTTQIAADMSRLTGDPFDVGNEK